MIDFGIVGTVEPNSWQSALSLLDGLRRRDPVKAARAIIAIGSGSAHVDMDAVAHDLGVLLVYPQRCRPGERQHMANADEVAAGIVTLSQEHDLRFPRELFLLLKRYMYFDFTTAILTEIDVRPEQCRS